MLRIKSKPGLSNFYKQRPQDVQDHFEHVLKLLESNFPLEVCLAYVFYRLEYGQNMALYCGLVRVHNIDSKFAKDAVAKQHITRSSFVSLYKNVFELQVPENARQDFEEAERVRDAIMHGKPASDDRMRNTIARVLEYAEIINERLNQKHMFRPFVRSLRGFAGGKKKFLDRKASRFVLKGMGFHLD